MIELDWRNVGTTVEDPTLEIEYGAMESLARGIVEKKGDGIAIEVGSFWGKSTVLLAQFFNVIAIDIWGIGQAQGNTGAMAKYSDIGGDSFSVFIKNVTERGLIYWDKNEMSQSRIIPICGTSIVLDHFPQLDARFAFVDAEHTYPSAYNDMCRCARHLIPGGILALHDCARPKWGWPDFSRNEADPWDGNYQSFCKFIDDNQDFRVLDHVEGIMFMEKKE